MSPLGVVAALLTVQPPVRADLVPLFEERRIEAGETVRVAADLPEVRPRHQVRLGLRARLDWPAFGGHNPFLGVQVNGHVVGPGRLANKPLEFTMLDGSDASWYGQGIWRLLYAPDFTDEMLKHPSAYMVADPDPYTFVWDVTPFAKPGTNTISLWHPKLLAQPTTVVVAEARLEIGAPIVAAAAGEGTADRDAPLRTYVTRTMLQMQIPTFTETSSFAFLVDTHLGAPWGLGTHEAEQSDRARAYMARRMLDHAGVLSVYCWQDDPAAPSFVRRFFPTTPTELRPGVVLAEERILTNRSGRFGWPDSSRAEVYVFDAEGRSVKRPEAREVREGNRVLMELRLAPGRFAALVRER